jgi:hypothetical protein
LIFIPPTPQKLYRHPQPSSGMKNNYDKILFLLGLIILVIGAGIYLQKGGTPKPSPIPPLHLVGPGYTPIPVPPTKEQNPLWEAPVDQRELLNDPGWTYSIFTPPKIWWETGNGWIVQPPVPVGPPPPFGVHLVRSDEERYRVQVQGVSGAGDKDDIINFSDEDDGNDFQLKVGEESTLHQIKVLDMTIPDLPDVSHGIWNKNAIVKILDERTNETLTLTQGVIYSPTGNRFCVLQFEEPFGTDEWRVTKVGDSQEFPGSTINLPDPVKFVVDAIDFDTPSVTVERQSKNKRHIDVAPIPGVTIQTLTLPDTSMPAPEVSATTAPKTPTRSFSTPASKPPAANFQAPAPMHAASTITVNKVPAAASTTPKSSSAQSIGVKQAPASSSGTGYNK